MINNVNFVRINYFKFLPKKGKISQGEIQY